MVTVMLATTATYNVLFEPSNVVMKAANFGACEVITVRSIGLLNRATLRFEAMDLQTLFVSTAVFIVSIVVMLSRASVVRLAPCS